MMKKVNAVFLLRCPIEEFKEILEFLDFVMTDTHIIHHRYSDYEFKIRELIPADYLEVKK